jgi:poly(3-hydroxybutyrate) depolymerase
LNHLFAKIRGAISRYCAIVSGATLALALTAGSPPATAYQFDSADPDAVSPEIATSTVGCGKVPGHTGVFTLTTTDGLGKTRSFLVQVPATYNPTKAYPLSFVFHGAGGNSSQSYSWGLQNTSGASENGIFVFPNGIAYKNYGIGWDDTNAGYDMPFFDNMVKQVETSYCVNSARVFVAGFSWGGDFVTALTCNRGQVIRAAAVNSATDEFRSSTNYTTYQDLPCPTTTHPPVRFEHANGGDAAYPSPLFGTTAALFRSFNSCTDTKTAVHSSTSTMTCYSFNSCAKEFIECNFNPSIGHALPPNWAADAWAFFQTFP